MEIKRMVEIKDTEEFKRWLWIEILIAVSNKKITNDEGLEIIAKIEKFTR